MSDEQISSYALEYQMYLKHNRVLRDIRYCLKHIIYEYNENSTIPDELTPELMQQIDRCERLYYERRIP